MQLKLIIGKEDIQEVKQFIRDNHNNFVQNRIDRNVNGFNGPITKDRVFKAMMMCLLTSTQRSGPNTPVGRFLRQKRFPITFRRLSNENNIRSFIRNTLSENGLNRFKKKIPKFFNANYQKLVESDWQLLKQLEPLTHKHSKKKEREIADAIAAEYDGIGPKQARNFLQVLGLTKYEIPIDSRITDWLNDFGFPLKLAAGPLQDNGYYHFISDCFQDLCKQAHVYPCVLDAAIFASVDEEGAWDDAETIY